MSEKVSLDKPHIAPVKLHSPNPVVTVIKHENDRIVRAIDVRYKSANLKPLPEGEKRIPINPRFVYFSICLQKAGFSASREALENLDVLDLGSGSDYFTKTGMTFAPELCRALHKIGTHVVGVDRLFPNRKKVDEGWEFHLLELIKKGALDKFSNNSFDIVNIGKLIGHTKDGNISPGLPWHSLDNPEYIRFEAEILNQTLRILRPNGIVIINYECVYQKVLGDDLKFRFKRISENGFNDLPYEFLDVEALVSEEESL